VAAVALAAGGALARVPGAVPLLVAVGEVGPDRAVIWARPPGAGTVVVELGLAAASSPRRRRLASEAQRGRDFAVKLRAAGLAAGTRYAYRVTWRGAEVEGTFVTAPEPDAPAPVHLVWSGDLGGGGRCRARECGYAVFRAMAERRPDFFVFAGDTMYADVLCPAPPNEPGADFVARDLAGFRAKARYNRADPALQAFLRATSVYATWDDHEVRNDFAGTAEPLMADGLRAFLEYWPIDPPAAEPTRLYRRFRWGRLVELLVLDTRQYRSDNRAPDGPAKTMLGAAQRRWLVDRLVRSDAVWKLVVSSVSLSIPTGRMARDSWANGTTAADPDGSPTGFEHELGLIVEELARQRVKNVAWLVADVHRAEVIRHAPRAGLVFHELVAGPLSAGLGQPGLLDDTLRPERLFAQGGYDNFGELRITAEGLTVAIVDGEGRTRYETVLRPEP
jgi:alkaline phosphatase D